MMLLPALFDRRAYILIQLAQSIHWQTESGQAVLPPQSPHSFTALAHLGLSVRPTKTVMLRKLGGFPLLHNFYARKCMKGHT